MLYNLAVLLSHGAYGTGADGDDYAANGCRQMYFPITSGGGGEFLALSDMNLGGSGTNGLKWFAILACTSLYPANWQDMQNYGVYPYNGNLHLLLGTATKSYVDGSVLACWAQFMNYGVSPNYNQGPYNPLTIRAAWYKAAQVAYANDLFPSGTVVKFVVAGDTACQNDSLQSNNSPAGSWFYDTPVQVYP